MVLKQVSIISLSSMIQTGLNLIIITAKSRNI